MKKQVLSIMTTLTLTAFVGCKNGSKTQAFKIYRGMFC